MWEHFFNGGTTLNFVSVTSGVVGVFLAVYFYFKSIKEKKPVYNQYSFNLINASVTTIKNLEIKYRDTTVKRLTLTRFAFWNGGKEPIRNSDIASTDPIIIYSKSETVFYDFEVSLDKQVNQIVVIRLGERMLQVSFEFLDLNDGFVINVYHNGSHNNDISIKGTIIGGRKVAPFKKAYFSEKADVAFKPINFLINHKNWALKIIGWTFVLMLLPCMMVFALAVLLLDTINYKVINKIPKEFEYPGTNT